jgi:hypothetical protein
MRLVLRLMLLAFFVAFINGCGSPTSPIVTSPPPGTVDKRTTADKAMTPDKIPPPPKP